MRVTHNLPVPPPQPLTPCAEVIAIRTSWKWAYLSHFLFTYNPMLHLEDIQLSELEDDLAGGTFEVIPTVMQRLLTSLTPHDKRNILENWQHHLRKQSLRRDPDHNLLGTEEEPIDFSSLIMSDKLHVLQCLCEWQFHNPNNLRTRMRDDDDYANWRIEPIAYDAKGNAYWLMGGNRLWIQYAPPKRVAKSHKRKQSATSTNFRKSGKRGTTTTSSNAISASFTLKPKQAVVTSSSGRSTRSTRNRQVPPRSSGSHIPRNVGTRVSTRLRGKEEEEVWQPIPEEWLKESSGVDLAGTPGHQLNGKQKGKEVEVGKGVVLKSLDDVSELTSLSDLSDIEEEREEDKDDDDEIQEITPIPSLDMWSVGGDAWETVCVTLEEWEAFPRRFENSTHRGEKSFYKLLINDLVPMITEVLRVDVRKKHMEEAVVHRKRSSRIAVKESLREAERAEARRRADEEKEMQRHRRWEARARKEEEERLRREALRSTRLRERGRGESESMDVDVVGGDSGNKSQMANGSAPQIPPLIVTPVKFVVNNSKTDTQTPKEDEPWELDCEVCHKHGMNLDDGQELMSCERCNKWQHIRCHDQADFIAGKPRRNWEIVDFVCSACATRNVVSQPYGCFTQGQTQVQHNGSLVAHVNGAMRTQPDHPTSQPIKSALKQHTAFDVGPYSNGRTSYPSPQLPHSTPTAPPHTSRQPTVTLNGNAAHPTSNSQLHTSTAAPHISTPNLYLSNYASTYRPPHNMHNVAQPQQSSPPLYPNARGQTAVPSTHSGGWPQQQTQYNHLATWNGVAHGSISQYTGTNASQVFEQPQQNKYYRPHTALPPNPLPQPQQLTSAQSYYSGGPTSQS